MAYATVTAGLGRQTLRRRPAESEAEYLGRVLGELELGCGVTAPADRTVRDRPLLR